MRYFYSVNTTPGGTLVHQARFSCQLETDPDPGDAFTTFSVTTSGGGSLVASTVASGTQNVIEDFLNSTDASIDYVELWKYTPGTFQATYVTSHDISGSGTSSTATDPAGQVIFTMRTTGGGVFKVNLLDTVGGYALPTSYDDSSSVAQDLFDYFTHSTNAPYIGRDNTYPFVPMRVFPGQNEHVFKTRYGR